MNTEAEARACIDSLPTDFALGGVLSLFEIVYYAFEIWKSCHTSADIALCCGSSYPTPLFRKARLGVLKAIRHHRQVLSQEQTDNLTAHMLDHVSTSSPGTIAACCSEVKS